MHLLRVLLPVFIALLSLSELKSEETVINPGYFTVGNVVYNATTMNDQAVAYLVGPAEGVEIVNLEVPAEVQTPDGCNLPVVGIEYNAFAQDFTIETVKLPATLIDWSSGFFNCINLRSIEVAEDNPELTSVDGVLYSKDKTILIVYPSGAERTSYIVPEGVECIWYYAFVQVRKLESLALPTTLNKIYDYAFCYCTSLTEMDLPEGITTIPESLFEGSSIESVNLPSTISTIEENAFRYCEELKSFTIKASIPPFAVDICENTKKVFENCILKVPVDALGAYRTTAPWNRFTNIQPIVGEQPDEPVTEDIFEVDGLEFLIRDDVSENEVGLLGKTEEAIFRHLEIPQSVSHNGVTYSVTCIGANAFKYDNYIESVKIPATIRTDFWVIGGFAGAPNLQTIEVAEDSPYLTAKDGVLYTKNMSTLILYPAGNTRSTFEIPAEVSSLLDESFTQCNNLQEIKIPKSVSIIDSETFYEGCANLVRIEVDPENPYFYATKEGALINDRDKSLVIYPPKCENQVFVTPGSVKSICPFAICKAHNLKIVKLSDISDYEGEIFTDCPNLTSVIIGYRQFINNIDPLLDAIYQMPETCKIYVETTLLDKYKEEFSRSSDLSSYFKPATEFNNFCADGFRYYMNHRADFDMKKEWLSLAIAGLSEGNEVTDLVIPSEVEYMGVTFPVKEIYTDAFKYNTSIESLTIPASLEEMSGGAFSGCSNLKKIVVDPANNNFHVEDNVLYYNYTYEGQTYYDLALFPNGLKNTEFVIPEGINYLCHEAFSMGNALESITLPSTISPSNAGLSSCENLKEIKVADGNDYVTIVDNVLYNKDMSMLYCYPGGLTASSFEIPETVGKVETHAFDACESLKTVIINKAPAEEYSNSLFGEHSNVSTLICKTTTPPGTNVFAVSGRYFGWIAGNPDKYKSCTLYVPDEAVETYRQYPYYDWSLIETILPLSELKIDNPIEEPIDTAAIQPLTVAEAIARNNSEEMVWVKGFINGSMTFNDDFTGHVFESFAPFSEVGNITIADSEQENDRSRMVAVQLLVGSDVRRILNLKEHPENLGKRVAVFGRLTKYFSDAGLKDVTLFILDYEDSSEDGILEIADEADGELRIYDLQGHRLTKPIRGMNIINGRKIMLY